MEVKTLKDLGILLDESSGCNTCNDTTCSASATKISTNQIYHITITRIYDGSHHISGSLNASVESYDDFNMSFKDEQSIAKYLNENFEQFKCF